LVERELNYAQKVLISISVVDIAFPMTLLFVPADVDIQPAVSDR
jgi:hypothetical protein